MKGLEKIIERIETASSAECAQIKSAAEAEAERINSEYRAKAEEAEADIAERTEREAEGIIIRAKSNAAMSRRNIIASERSRNVDRAFENALDAIVSLPKDKYMSIVVKLAVSAVKRHTAAAEYRLETYGEATKSVPYELVLNANDRIEIGEAVLLSMKNNYKKELGTDAARRLTLSDDTADIVGGIIVKAGAVEENCSLSLLIDGLHDSLDGEVYKTLYPEG